VANLSHRRRQVRGSRALSPRKVRADSLH
jgi:hypothetical protein